MKKKLLATEEEIHLLAIKNTVYRDAAADEIQWREREMKHQIALKLQEMMGEKGDFLVHLEPIQIRSVPFPFEGKEMLLEASIVKVSVKAVITGSL